MNNLKILPITEIASKTGLNPENILLYGKYIAKVPIEELFKRADTKDGELILVTAMTPTPKGEGKTTTTIGLGDALSYLGYKTAICLREPSLGPFFGIKGGGTGSGKCQVIPSEDINLHFVGDMYAVEKANNLLAALTDNHLQHKNRLKIDPRRIVLHRVIDLNDRALREIVIGLGGPLNGIPRKDGFNITPASEVMAILCLASDFKDLGKRLSRIIVGFTYEGEPVTAEDLKATVAMQIILKDAINPNLVQTLYNTPAFIHGGPFANIAQGTNSAIATKLALKYASYVITEAGFGTDLGAEKFFDIKCRIANIKPSAVVIVTTCRAIKYHGGKKGGLDNLAKHIENIQLFGIEPVVCINRFKEDNDSDISEIIKFCKRKNIFVSVSSHHREGPKGSTELAKMVLESIKVNKNKKFKFLYSLSLHPVEKIKTIAKKIYGAKDIRFDRKALVDLSLIEKNRLEELSICMAKTPLSLSDNPDIRGMPKDFILTVNEIRISAGAGFLVPICGQIVTMPGLPAKPAAIKMKIKD